MRKIRVKTILSASLSVTKSRIDRFLIHKRSLRKISLVEAYKFINGECNGWDYAIFRVFCLEKTDS